MQVKVFIVTGLLFAFISAYQQDKPTSVLPKIQFRHHKIDGLINVIHFTNKEGS
jgi:hypothetical protein